MLALIIRTCKNKHLLSSQEYIHILCIACTCIKLLPLGTSLLRMKHTLLKWIIQKRQMGAQTFYPETIFSEGGETSSKAKPNSAVKTSWIYKNYEKKYRRRVMNYSSTLHWDSSLHKEILSIFESLSKIHCPVNTEV